MKLPMCTLIKGISLISIAALFSCSRAGDDKATVSFNLPASYWANQSQGSNSQSNYVSNLLQVAQNSTQLYSSNVSTANSSNDQWREIIPTGYDTGQTPINCVFIVATGPQLDQSACFKKVSGSTTDTQVIKFGDISLPMEVVGTGAELSLKVTPGSDRIFYLLGMNAVENGCLPFGDDKFERQALSKPFIIGKTIPVKIEAGALNKVTLTLTSAVNPNDYIDYCDTPEAPGLLNPPENLSVAKVELSLNRELTKNVAYNNQCVPMTIRFKDSSGLVNIQSPYSENLSLETEQADPVGTYSSAQSCLNNTNQRTSISTLNNFETTVWIKADQSILNNQSIRLQGMIGNTIPLAGVEVPVAVTERMLVVSTPTTKFATINAPDRILNGVCYQATLSANNGNFSVPGFFEANNTANAGYIDSSASGVLTFHDGPDCQSIGTPTQSLFSGTNHGFYTVWFKVSGYSVGSEITLLHSYTVTPSAIVRTKMTVVTGTIEPAKLKISGPTDLINPANTSCYGPYRVEVTNSSGTSIGGNSETEALRRQYDVSLNFTSESTTQLFARGVSGTPCSGTEILNGSPQVITTTDGYIEFFVRVTNYTTEATSLIRYIGVFDVSPEANGVRLSPTEQLLRLAVASGPEDYRPPPPPVCAGARLGEINCYIP